MSTEALKFDQVKAGMNLEFTWDRIVNNLTLDHYHYASASVCITRYPSLHGIGTYK